MKPCLRDLSQLSLALVPVMGVLAVASAPWALDQAWMNWLFKPLTTLAVISYAWERGRHTPVQRRWVLIGLVLSLLGDVALLWPQEGFLPGLISFQLAHGAYLVAFTRDVPFMARKLPFAFYALVAGAVLAQLWAGVPAGMRGPVGGYVLFLAAMAAQAAVLWRLGLPRGRWVALGGALFVCSDALLAWSRFVQPLPLSGLWILATYWSAQVLIASWLAPAEPRLPAT
jgi:uncharacterized membrane protein YhhN